MCAVLRNFLRITFSFRSLGEWKERKFHLTKSTGYTVLFNLNKEIMTAITYQNDDDIIIIITFILFLFYSRLLVMDANTPILLDDVACTGFESNLFDCSYSSINSCDHTTDVGLICALSKFSICLMICLAYMYIGRTTRVLPHDLTECALFWYKGAKVENWN